MAPQLPRTVLDSLEEGIQNLRRCAEADLPTPQLAELVGATLELRNRLDAAWLREAHRLGNGTA